MLVFFKHVCVETQLGLPQTFKMEIFTTIVNGFWLLTILAKLSIFMFTGGPGYACTMVCKPHATADLVTFTEEILNGKLRCFVQCQASEKASRVKKKNCN